VGIPGACTGAAQCGPDESQIALDMYDGPDANEDTHTCKQPGDAGPGLTPWSNIDIAFYCNPSGMAKVGFRLIWPV
jgi:hypothetical protein